jgi:hypothetical protein
MLSEYQYFMGNQLLLRGFTLSAESADKDGTGW